MVYLYVEDSNAGLYLMKLAQKIYNVDDSKLKIDTFNGIFDVIDTKNINVNPKVG